MIIFNLPQLMAEREVKPIDLVRFGMAQGTAYSLAKGEVTRIDFGSLALLCSFFDVTVGELLVFEPLGDPEPEAVPA